MKRNARPAELAAQIADYEASQAWLAWCRVAVKDGVRFDLAPSALLELPLMVVSARGTRIEREKKQ